MVYSWTRTHIPLEKEITVSEILESLRRWLLLWEKKNSKHCVWSLIRWQIWYYFPNLIAHNTLLKHREVLLVIIAEEIWRDLKQDDNIALWKENHMKEKKHACIELFQWQI